MDLLEVAVEQWCLVAMRVWPQTYLAVAASCVAVKRPLQPIRHLEMGWRVEVERYLKRLIRGSLISSVRVFAFASGAWQSSSGLLAF